MSEVDDLIRDIKRYREDALAELQAINAGVPLGEGLSRNDAIKRLNESIAHFETILRRYGWEGDDHA